MARPNLYIKDWSEKESLILLQFNYKRLGKSLRLKYSTQIAVPVQYWDKEKQLLKKVAGFPQATAINAVLNKYKAESERIYYEYIALDKIKELTIDKFKEELSIAFKRHSVRSIDLIGYFERRIEEMTVDCEKRGTRTHMHFKVELKRLKEYYKIKPFDFEDINLEWLEMYKDFLYSTDLSSVSVAKSCSRFKTVMKRALLEKIHDNTDFQTDLFRVGVVERGHTYLTIEEISSLYYLEVDQEGQEKIRDLFVLACFTGLRVSDWHKITVDNFYIQDGTQMFQINTKKKDKHVTIPAHPLVLAILKKYRWQLPKFAEPYINREIKELCKRAGIDKMVTLKESKGGIVKHVEKPKFELITLHTSRRSFATNALLAGIDLDTIKDMLGHSKISTTEKYIKATGVQKAKKASKNKFFSGDGFLKVG